jgi:putative hydroxymethylpyrimidine transport system substrate-binding protein
MRPRLTRPALALVCMLALAACGGSSTHSARPTTASVRVHRLQSASLILDFTPNAVHVGIYTALARHLDSANGLALHVEVPGASTDAISELEAGRVNFAILDIHDLAIADASDPTHPPIVGILPIVERPLAAVLAAPAIHSPQDLTGRTVGVTGDPSDLAVLHSIVAGSGGDPTQVKTIDIGYDAVADLVSGRVTAATGFWNDEGVTLRRERPGFHVYRVDDYGAPSYPELVVCTTAQSLRRDPTQARALVRTLTEGYDDALAHPATGARDLESEVDGLDPSLVTAELPGLESAFTGPEGHFGVLDIPLLRRWAAWEAHFGIVKRVPDVSAMFDTAFAPRG